MANQRQGTHKTKERAEITGSTRKIKRSCLNRIDCDRYQRHYEGCSRKNLLIRIISWFNLFIQDGILENVVKT